MFGRLPWLAFERRMRALRFLVFFDIGVKAIGQISQRHKARQEREKGLTSPDASGRDHWNMALRRHWLWHTHSFSR